MKRLKTRLAKQGPGGGLAGAEQYGAETFSMIGRAWDEWMDDVFDQHISTLTKEGAKAYRQALMGNKKELEDIFKKASGIEAASRKAATRSTIRESMGSTSALLMSGGMSSAIGGIGAGLGALGDLGAGDYLRSMVGEEKSLEGQHRDALEAVGATTSQQGQKVADFLQGGMGDIGISDEARAAYINTIGKIPGLEGMSPQAQREAKVRALREELKGMPEGFRGKGYEGEALGADEEERFQWVCQTAVNGRHSRK